MKTKPNPEWEEELVGSLRSWATNHPEFNRHTVDHTEKSIANVIRGIARFQKMKTEHPLEYKLWLLAVRFFQHNKHYKIGAD